jgi:cell shape-determining protein MreD
LDVFSSDLAPLRLGIKPMNVFRTILILAAAFLAVFGEAKFPVLRHWLDAQVDLLPVLMVYAALNADLATISLLAVLGGLWFDALSANPFGASILPLFAVGFVIYLRRDLILRELSFAQLILGTMASAAVPVLSILLLLTAGKQPLLGWGSLWQWLVMTAGGAAATPFVFALFNWCNRALGYQPRIETSFRPDREIRRGRL